VDDEQTLAYMESMDEQLSAITRFLCSIHGSETAARVCEEISNVIALSPTDGMSMQCKRALLLYAINAESEIAKEYIARDGERDASASRSALSLSASDMQLRALPMITPRFVVEMCQRPDVYVRSAVVLGVMWANEPLDSRLACGPGGESVE
jgi:hypothetical protein